MIRVREGEKKKNIRCYDILEKVQDSSGSVTWNIEFFNDKSHLDSPELFARAVNVDMGREEEEEEEEEKEK